MSLRNGLNLYSNRFQALEVTLNFVKGAERKPFSSRFHGIDSSTELGYLS